MCKSFSCLRVMVGLCEDISQIPTGLSAQLHVHVDGTQHISGVKFRREVTKVFGSLGPENIEHFSVHQSKPGQRNP